MIDEAGRLVKGPFNVNVKNQKHLAMLEKWLSDPDYNAMLLHEMKPSSEAVIKMNAEAAARFHWKAVKRRKRWRNGERHSR